MVTERQVHQRLRSLSKGEIELYEFAQWVDRASWDVQLDSAEPAIKLLSAIQRLIFDCEDGVISQDVLVHGLLGLSTAIRNDVAFFIDDHRIQPVAPYVSSSVNSASVRPVADLVPA